MPRVLRTRPARGAAAAFAAALAAAALAAAWYGGQATRPAATAPGPTTGLARVVRTDLVTTQPVPGTIGYGPVTTLAAAGGSSAAAVAQAQGAVAAATQKLGADRQAAADQAAASQQAVNQAQAALAADQAALASDQQALDADQQRLNQDRQRQPPDPQAVAADGQKVQADTAKVAADGAKVQSDQAAQGAAQAQARQKQDQADAQVAADQVALTAAGQALAPVQALTVHGGVYSGLPAPGDTIARGQPLYWTDGHPVPLFYGPVAMYRLLAVGCSGPDVQQLEENLLQLGFADGSSLAADGSFGAADAAAVGRWQASAGLPQTGQVALGDLVFLPGPVRVAAVHPGAGAPVQAGQPILDLTATTRVVTVNLTPSLAFSVRQGDPVTVDLPDGRTRARGTVSAVSRVAQQAPTTAQTANGAPQSVIPVTIALDDPAQVPPLDQAPVTVDVTTQSVRGVLAVPVNALLALQGGGYAVEVPAAGGGTRLVPVQTGIFDASRVQVSGAGLAEGMSVVVPQ